MLVMARSIKADGSVVQKTHGALAGKDVEALFDSRSIDQDVRQQ
jgi:hypothetical protein